MRLSRGSVALCVGVTVYVLLWLLGARNMSTEVISTEAVLGTVGKLPYVTFYSSKSAGTWSHTCHLKPGKVVLTFPFEDRPNSADGWWSLAQNEVGQFVVVPGHIVDSLSSLLHTQRDGMIKIGVKADTWHHAGLLEGYVLSREIHTHLAYFEKHYQSLTSAWQHVKGQKMANFDELKSFFATQVDSVRIRPPATLPALKEVLQHMEGVVEGYNMRYASQIANQKMVALSLSDLFLLNSYPDLVEAGLYANLQTIDFGSPSKTQYEKRVGRETALLSSLFLSGRVSGSLIQLDVAGTSGTYNLSTTRAMWENQPWYPSHFRRVLSRVSVGLGSSVVGYQFLGFPGQVISMDSFALSLSLQRMTLVVMKQADFSDSKRSRNSPPAPPLSAWMLVASAFHTHNITVPKYMTMWRQAKQALLTAEWKSLVVAENQIRELETHYDAFQISSVLDSLTSRHFHFASPTTTLLKQPLLDEHGFKNVKYNKDEETLLQTTSVDAYQQESIWRALKQPVEINPAKILATATNPTLEEIKQDLGNKFDIDIARQVEIVELASMA